jgi:hypothetical protein
MTFHAVIDAAQNLIRSSASLTWLSEWLRSCSSNVCVASDCLPMQAHDNIRQSEPLVGPVYKLATQMKWKQSKLRARRVIRREKEGDCKRFSRSQRSNDRLVGFRAYFV